MSPRREGSSYEDESTRDPSSVLLCAKDCLGPTQILVREEYVGGLTAPRKGVVGHSNVLGRDVCSYEDHPVQMVDRQSVDRRVRPFSEVQVGGEGVGGSYFATDLFRTRVQVQEGNRREDGTHPRKFKEGTGKLRGFLRAPGDWTAVVPSLPSPSAGPGRPLTPHVG